MTIENVLKGNVLAGNTDFFVFQQVYPTGAPTIGFFGTRMFHDMLLLRRERGKLRLLRDVKSNCAAVVYSGAHINAKLPSSVPLAERMIDLLLTPGEGATDSGMVRAIFERTPVEISPTYAATALLKLAVSGSPIVRTAACLEFRDIVVELIDKDPRREFALNQQFGISTSELRRWREQQQQNGRARNWWAHGPFFVKPPSTSLPANGPVGLNLCQNDVALGVPPLHTR